MVKYPAISQFKSLIREVSLDCRYMGKDEDGHPLYNNNQLPILDFIGTCKIHGSNGSVRYDNTGNLVAQSRERELSLLSDNHGFCAFIFKHEELIRGLCENLIQDNDQVVIYGEWFGQGINGGVAVNQLSKRFAVFGIRWIKEGITDFWADTINLSHWLNPFINDLNNNNVYNIAQFGIWNISIDFNNPTMIQNKLIEITNSIEKECPVGRYFGISGTGEGAVWSHISKKFYQFKVKGFLHQNSKVKSLAPVDEELLKNVKEFADNFVTEARLKQGIEFLKYELLLDPIPTNMGPFIRFIVSDIMKEESNAMLQSDLNPKKVAQEISKLARNWFIKNNDYQ